MLIEFTFLLSSQIEGMAICHPTMRTQIRLLKSSTGKHIAVLSSHAGILITTLNVPPNPKFINVYDYDNGKKVLGQLVVSPVNPTFLKCCFLSVLGSL